jgi:type III secretion protein W
MTDESHLSAARHVAQSEMVRAQKAAQVQLANYVIMQESSEDEFTEWTELAAFNPLALARRFETLEVKAKKKEKDEEAEKASNKKVLEIKKLEETSEQYQRKNPELQARTLLLLRSRLAKGDSKEAVLKKVLETYPDYSLADEALDYLLETADADLMNSIREAKEELNTTFGREIRAGRNIAEQAREFSRQGLGSPTGLREMYRDITGNPRDPATLFDELTKNFTYDKMKSVIDFLLHSLGSDLKSKGPSIARAELHRLMTESRTLQAILGVYRFFKSRLKLVDLSFRRFGLSLPSRMSFELLAKQFMKFLQERYPSIDKLLQMAALLGISEEEMAQIIIYTQYRDAIRQVAPKLFRSEQHRQDVLSIFIETLEELEDRLEEKEEEKEEKEEDKDKKEKEK